MDSTWISQSEMTYLTVTYCELFNTKAIFAYEQHGYCLTNKLEDKGVHTFSKGINLKVNVIVLLEFGLTTMLQSSTLATPPVI